MRIQGFVGTTFLDYPQHIAASVFTAGCNFRCPFCHNPSLVVPESEHADISCSEILARVQNRIGFIDGVVVSGGEPLIQEGLPEFLFQIRQLGAKVKIDTNGALPDMLRSLLEAHLVDFVAMDVKSVPEKYAKAAGVRVDWGSIERSIELILRADIQHEFRTTVVPGIVSPEDIPAIARLISGAKRFSLQQFRPDVTLDPQMRELKPFLLPELEKMAIQAKAHVAEARVIGN